MQRCNKLDYLDRELLVILSFVKHEKAFVRVSKYFPSPGQLSCGETKTNKQHYL